MVANREHKTPKWFSAAVLGVETIWCESLIQKAGIQPALNFQNFRIVFQVLEYM